MSNYMKSVWYATSAISEYRKELESRLSRVNEYAPLERVAYDFVNVFREPDATFEYEGPDTRVTLTLDPSTVNAFCINRDVLSMTEVTPMLRWLRDRLGVGYKIEDFPELGRRAYCFKVPNPAATESHPTLHFRFQIFFNKSADKQVCKFVQVGVKEEPVYKLVCEGEEVPTE